ncbi:MAG: hypothetical protein H7Z71_03945 [Moraxellaceae bacterium]|nr:hypothetical protein [Pseudobdellovibrionaceae bacterium]
MTPFKIFLGIDQTGATDQKGKPKKLNCTLIDAQNFDEGHDLQVYPGLHLEHLNTSAIKDLIKIHIKDFKNQPVLICIDTAFGLPLELNVHYKKIFEKAVHFQFNEKPFGALTAYQFFNSFLKSDEIVKRKVDQITKANSVFNLTPFQKNIGCGSFRSIKELALNLNDFDLWPFELTKKQFVMAEGYPSYNWKKLLKIKNRSLIELKKKLPTLNFENVDQADSFILALGALKYQKQIFQKSPAIAKKEGWILGVPYE